MAHLLALGYGFSARMIGPPLVRRGWRVTGTSRTPQPDGDIPLLTVAQALDMCHDATHLLVSIPPNDAGDPVLSTSVSALRRLSQLKWIGYLSTIGVYGDYKGAWIDETASLYPRHGRSIRRAQAERAWLAFAANRGIACQVFRLAGIYGPGRSPLERVQAGRAQRIIKPGQVFNRIHVADIAQTVLAGLQRPAAGPIFNVTDDEPAPPQDVVAYAAELLGAQPLPDVAFEQAEMSPMARSFYADNNRVRNTYLKQALDVVLAYPTYRDGLRALLAEIQK